MGKIYKNRNKDWVEEGYTRFEFLLDPSPFLIEWL